MSAGWVEDELKAALDEAYQPAPWLLSRCMGAVRQLRPARPGQSARAWLAGATAVLIAASSIAIFESLRLSTSSSHPRPQTSGGLPAYALAGGCAGTVLTDGLPPTWAQGGWSAPAVPWPVPWTLGTGGEAVAYVFAIQLVAGSSPRVDGTNNKVLWVAKGAPPNFSVDAHPLGLDHPVIKIAGGPSIVDLPTAGCWTFDLTWGPSGHTASSAINLDVLPAGSVPPPIPVQLLRARPLILPTIAPGGACPVSPVTLVGGVAPRIGTPLRLGFGSAAGPEGAFAFNKTVLDYITAPASPTVLLRGIRLDGTGKLYFGRPGLVGALAPAIRVADPQGSEVPFYSDLPLSVDSSSVFYTYPTSPGCYGIQVDAEGFSEVIVFDAT